MSDEQQLPEDHYLADPFPVDQDGDDEDLPELHRRPGDSREFAFYVAIPLVLLGILGTGWIGEAVYEWLVPFLRSLLVN